MVLKVKCVALKVKPGNHILSLRYEVLGCIRMQTLVKALRLLGFWLQFGRGEGSEEIPGTHLIQYGL